MTRNLDWKWIGFGVLIMLALNIVAGIIFGFFITSELEGANGVEDIQLDGGDMAVLAVLNFLAFAIGGFIVGLKSTGRTILEPGISAAVTVIIGLLLSRNFSLGNVLAGALIPFLAGILGGWIGERRQETGTSPKKH